jgi:AraC family ethanolamine operon transcriptional activator
MIFIASSVILRSWIAIVFWCREFQTMLTELRSNDCDELSESLAHTEQEFRQLQSGDFAGQWRRLELPGVSIVQDHVSHAIYNSAAIPEGFAIAFIPIKQRGTLTMEGHNWDDAGIFLCGPNTRPILTIPSDFVSYTVEFDLAILRRTANSCGWTLFPEHVAVGHLASAPMRAAATELISAAYCTTGVCVDQTPQQRVDRFLSGWSDLLRQSFGQPDPIDRSTLSQRRRATLNAANYMTTHICEDISLTDLCEAAGVTDRTLRNGFQEMFCMSPMRWLKRERLSAARRDLKAADPELQLVRTIAIKYGFSQFAHFATDYRALFGESPSETLRR